MDGAPAADTAGDDDADGPAPPIIERGSARPSPRRGARRGGGGRGRGRGRRSSGGGALKGLAIGCGLLVVLGCGGLLLLGVRAKSSLASPAAQQAVQLAQSLQVNAERLGGASERDARSVSEDVARAILGNDAGALQAVARRCDRLAQSWRQRARQLEGSDRGAAARSELCASDASALAEACRERADELR
jgi:hypothetical protein